MSANEVMDEDFDDDASALEHKLFLIARLVGEFRQEWYRKSLGGQQVQPRWLVPFGAIKELEKILES